MANKMLYSTVQSPIADKGICFLEWHDRGGVERILSWVEKRYKKNLVQGISKHLIKLQNDLGNYFDGTINKFLVPIDVDGTNFENKV